MAMSRLDIQEKLENLDPSLHVYYQAPPKPEMRFPAIIYKLDNIAQRFADDNTYNKDRSYMLTLIHSNPDNDIVDRLLFAFPKIRFDRSYVSDNLYHYIYILYE